MSDYTLPVQTLIDGSNARHFVCHPDPPDRWSADDVSDLLNWMCSLIRPDGAQYVYAFSPTKGRESGMFRIVVTVGADAAVSAPLSLQQAVVEEMVARSVERKH